MKQKAVLIAALLALGVSASVSADNKNNKLDQKVGITDKNLKKQREKAEDRIKDVSPDIWNEYKAGKLVLKFKPVKTSYLNGWYYQKFRGNPARIEIDCKPDFSVCSDAMYHELGHHVYKGLGAQAKSNLESALALRIKKPDAKKFRAEVKRLSDTNKRFIQLWSKYFSRYFHCNSMQSEIRLVNKVFATHGTCQQIMKKSKSRGKKYLCNDKALNDLKKQAAAFRKSMPNCNWKSLTKAHRMLNTLGKRFSKNMTTVYHKKGGVKYKRLQEIKGFPLADVNGVLYRIERKKFLDLTRIVLTDTAAAYQYQNPSKAQPTDHWARKRASVGLW